MTAPHPIVPGLTGLTLLARGGYATVYRAVQESVGREVAVKVENRLLESERDRRRFLREARASGKMSSHPHVVDLFDAGVCLGGHPYLIMELCEGSYADRMKTAPLDARETRDVGVKIADALADAHSIGVLHRDVKPANILISRFGEPALADFGLAILAETRDMSITLDVLTPAYAPPEMFRHDSPAPSGDVYALCATLYAMLRGRPPRWSEGGAPPSLTSMVDMFDKPIPDIVGVPRDLMGLLRRGLANNPASRPTAAALRDALAGLTLGDQETPPDDESTESITGTAITVPVEFGATEQPTEALAPPRPPDPPQDPFAAVPDASGPEDSWRSAGPADASDSQGDGRRLPEPQTGSPAPWENDPRGDPGQDSGGARAPHSTPVPQPPAPAAPRSRWRRRWRFIAAVVVADAVVAALAIGAFALSDWRGSDERSPGAADSGEVSTGPSGETSSPIQSVTSPSGQEGTACPYDSGGRDARCPTVAECYGSLVVTNGVARAEHVDCSARHTWEVFAFGEVPEDLVDTDYETVISDSGVQKVCSTATLIFLAGFDATVWNIEVLPPTAEEMGDGERTYRCLAGQGEQALTGAQLQLSTFGQEDQTAQAGG